LSWRIAVSAGLVLCSGAILVGALLTSTDSSDGPRGVLSFHADPSGDSVLYTMNADGTNVRLATTLVAGSPFSRWSPDGRLLAFISGSYGEGELMIVRPDGRQARTVTRHTVNAFDWSPDGRRLAYASGEGLIWTVGIQRGSRPRRVATGFGPDWSPDGAWLAYFRGPERRTDVFKVSVRRPRPIRLTTHPRFDHSPQWSPDGSQIAFVSERDRNSELYVVGARGGAARRLTADPAHDEFFTWSPNGRSLAYASYRDGADPHSLGIGNAEIFSVELETGRVRNLSQNREWDGDPAFSPDGEWIVFTRRTDHGEIAVMRVDGSEQTVHEGAVDAPLNDCCASWRPR
jgi:Tol biopolymer transport system component